MSIPANQQRTFLRLITQLRPHWRSDAALPARIQRVLAAHREFGSRDRRLYRELIYTTLRFLPWIDDLLETQPDEATRRVAWLAADIPATSVFRRAFATGEPPAGDKAVLLPGWFRAHCPAIFVGEELETQLRRAPLWLRLQADASGEANALDDLTARGWSWRRSTILPDAVELLTEADVTTTEAWKSGAFEVQDLGSQLILECVGITRGGHWLDACAGAGGKTLQLAQRLGPQGRVAAFDIRRAALEELQRRAVRAGQIIQVLSEAPRTLYDGVLVDAPCSGSGTWRRAPHLKWVTTEAHIERAAEKQAALLGQFARCVSPGGRLVYATCSLSSVENENVVAAFLAEHSDFQLQPLANIFSASPPGAQLTILPSHHDTDGFFVASMRRR
jgi:16S rRNA (cytosine967-C5)-methyltransferase